MKSLAAPFRQLVSSRLWPVALFLALAAIATPLVLADREELPPVPAAPATGMAALQAALVTPASNDLGRERRRVLGAAKDPFTPTGSQPKPEKPVATGTPAPTQMSTTAGTPATSSSPASGSGGGAPSAPSDPMTSSPGPSPDTAPTPAPLPELTPPAPNRPPAKAFALYSLKVRVNGEARTLKRLDALPDAETPAAIYLGLLEDGKTAVFLVDEGVRAEGDGRCVPSPSDCQRVHLRKGETEFFAVADGEELQVDLLDVRTKRTRSAGKARAAYAASSSPGRALLRERMDRVGRLRYNPRTGKLRELSLHGWRALVARAASRP